MFKRYTFKHKFKDNILIIKLKLIKVEIETDMIF